MFPIFFVGNYLKTERTELKKIDLRIQESKGAPSPIFACYRRQTSARIYVYIYLYIPIYIMKYNESLNDNTIGTVEDF